jgi:hypothetical protein
MRILMQPFPKDCGHCSISQENEGCWYCGVVLDENNDCVEIVNRTIRLRDCPIQPIVLCCQCQSYDSYEGINWCKLYATRVTPNHFCNDGRAK